MMDFCTRATLKPCVHVQAWKHSRLGYVMCTPPVGYNGSSTVNEIQLHPRKFFEKKKNRDSETSNVFLTTNSTWLVKVRQETGFHVRVRSPFM